VALPAAPATPAPPLALAPPLPDEPPAPSAAPPVPCTANVPPLLPEPAVPSEGLQPTNHAPSTSAATKNVGGAPPAPWREARSKAKDLKGAVVFFMVGDASREGARRGAVPSGVQPKNGSVITAA
jgi:hypothetical protein